MARTHCVKYLPRFLQGKAADAKPWLNVFREVFHKSIANFSMRT
jgi:hypothetical protein